MISLVDKHKIIISFFRDGKSISAISLETGFHRATIRKYIEEHSEKIRQAILENQEQEDHSS